MRRTRARYHYAIRQVKRDEDMLVRDRLADALIDDPNRNFWTEVKRIFNGKACSTLTVDDFVEESSIAQLFANKYRSLYSSVPFNAARAGRCIHRNGPKRNETDGKCQFWHARIPL